MASEAQRLIGISLTKIAQSRSHRGGVSLHKNLLVATVLQKARYIFMEEAYNMVHCAPPLPPPPPAPVQARAVPDDDDDLVGLTVEEAGLETVPDLEESSSSDDFMPGCVKCTENHQDKENHPPSYHSTTELTYLDLDKSSNVLRERCNSPSLKRRRAVAEWETEEAVQSILPKRSKQEEESDDVFLDDAALLSDVVSKEVEKQQQLEEASQQQSTNGGGSAMEIDRITSLVSIFSFSMGGGGAGVVGGGGGGCVGGDAGKINRSVSTPDLCSAQAKDTADSIQQRPFLAMTV